MHHLRSGLAPIFLVFGFVFGPACVSYTSGLGFRSRQAVLAGDAAAFRDLMEEAADTTPVGPLDNPVKTVLTHFLDLAARPEFFPFINDWIARGWVSDDMTCAIHRAHYRAVVTTDPASAETSASVCIDRARSAATDPARKWELETCLNEAPFLVATSTSDLARYIAIAADAGEPLRFRYALIEGMTRVDITSPERIRDATPSLSHDESLALAEQRATAQERRIDWVLNELRPHVPISTLASATSRGVLEVENVNVGLKKSYLARYALSTDPLDRDLAWAWVRTMKHRRKVPRIAGLGLWSRDRETKDDVYWYLCWGAPTVDNTRSLGPIQVVDAISIRKKAQVETPEPEPKEHSLCGKIRKTSAAYPNLFGPFPLETTARAALADHVRATGAHMNTMVRLKERITKPGP